jgi:hypothetical protein
MVRLDVKDKIGELPTITYYFVEYMNAINAANEILKRGNVEDPRCNIDSQGIVFYNNEFECHIESVEDITTEKIALDYAGNDWMKEI